jgi:predicted ABC-type ATPase
MAAIWIFRPRSSAWYASDGSRSIESAINTLATTLVNNPTRLSQSATAKSPFLKARIVARHAGFTVWLHLLRVQQIAIRRVQNLGWVKNVVRQLRLAITRAVEAA